MVKVVSHWIKDINILQRTATAHALGPPNQVPRPFDVELIIASHVTTLIRTNRRGTIRYLKSYAEESIPTVGCGRFESL